MYSRIKKITLLFGFILLVVLSSCSKKNKDTSHDKSLNNKKVRIKNELIIATSQDINQLNPLLQNDQVNQNCLALTHTALLSADKDTMEIIPMLAREWKWLDDTHLEIKLFENAKFSTGDLVNADDVVFTYKRAMSNDPKISLWSGVLNNVEDVAATGEHSVIFTLKKSDNDFLYTLNARGLSIQSKKAYENPKIDKPYLVGSGRYKLKEWKKGVSVTFEKVENYWGEEEAKSKYITFKPLVEASQRTVALQNGEIDVCLDPSANDLKFLNKDPNITVFQRDGSRLFYLGFNVSKPPFDDVSLRRAVSCAIDKDFIIKAVLNGYAKPQTSVLNRGNWSFLDNDEIEGYTFDLERAKELISKSKYPDGVNVNLYISSSDPYRSVAQIVQENLRKINVNVEIKMFDDSTLKSECQKGNQDFFLWRWNVMGRIDECFRDIFYTNSPANYHHLSDPIVDKLTDKVLTTKDETERLNLSHQLQRYHAGIVAQVPLYVPDLIVAYKRGLKGVILYGGGQHDWSKAYIEY